MSHEEQNIVIAIGIIIIIILGVIWNIVTKSVEKWSHFNITKK